MVPPRSLPAWATGAAASLGLAVALLAFAVRGSPLYQSTTLWQFYNSLFGPPFALWLLERWTDARRPGRADVAIDVAVVVLAAARSRGLVPLASGHAAWFVFALLTTTRRATRGVVLAGLAAAVVIKVLVWHNSVSVIAGAIVGAGAAWLWHRARRGGDLE